MACRDFEDATKLPNASRCQPPGSYNVTWLNLLIKYSCASAPSNSAGRLAAACARMGGSPVILIEDCGPFEGTSGWTACAEQLGGGCSAYARALYIMQARMLDSVTGDICCNSFYFDASGAPQLVCSRHPAPSPPGVLANLDPDVQGVLYAPFLPGADPMRSDDLYNDANAGLFRRDARVLHALGATTLLLEPWLDDTYHTSLFDALRFKPLPDAGLLEQEEQRERATWRRLNVVPTLGITSDELNLYTGLGANTMIDTLCQRVKRFVSYALTPEYGSTADAKQGVQAFNIDLLPNEKRKWTAPFGYTPWLDYAQQPGWNMFLIMQRVAACAKKAQQSFGDATHSQPVLVSIVDDVTAAAADPSVTVDGFLNLYAAFLSHTGATPTLDGFIVRASRSRGCSAESMVRSAVGHAATFTNPFGKPLRMWFSIGVGELAWPLRVQLM